MTYRIPTEEQTLAVESFRKFLLTEVRPVARSYRDRFIPKTTMRELTQRIAEFGLPGCTVPVEHGGMGWSYTTQGMLFEELAVCSRDIALCVMLNTALAAALLDAAPAVRERYLPETLAGRLFGALGISHPEAGPHVDEYATSAVRDGDCFIVNGTKAWVANGLYSDVLVCAVQTGRGSSHLLIDREEHGYEARSLDRNAFGSQATAQILFADTRVPVTHLIDEAGDGGRYSQKRREQASAHVGVLLVGLMRAVLDESVAYAAKRIGPAEAMAAHQSIAEKIAEMAIATDAARLLYQRVFGLMDAGMHSDMQASMAVMFAAQAAAQVCREAGRLHGAHSVTRASDIERMVREAIVLPMVDRTWETHTLAIAQASMA
jgi:alkylation response protein AidB-like acyl-CoA dehydrogenase